MNECSLSHFRQSTTRTGKDLQSFTNPINSASKNRQKGDTINISSFSTETVNG